MALFLVIVVFAGFAPSYYLRGAVPDSITSFLDDPPQPIRGLFLLHGALFSAWFLLQLGQSLLIGAGRLDLHRRMGVTALTLAPLLVLTSTLVVFYTVRNGFHDTKESPLKLAAHPVFLLIWFSGFVAAGMLLRRRPQWHKRLMLLASILMAQPAIARITWLPYPDFLPSWWEWIIPLVVPLLVWDLVTLRRLHPATIIGVTAFLVMFPLTNLVRATPEWLATIATLTH
ncbi:MAG TPA: hypothetical protein VHU18_04860 [Rhizomicrobium sp.]|jgi:hypothetical protein|nr:hypothetical protein [Rhizomicrobium sp.]